MPIKLTNKDHQSLDRLLRAILEKHAAGTVTTGETVGALAHVFTAAAIDNASEVRSWLNKPETLAEWEQMTDAHQT